MDKKAMYKISYGLFVVTSAAGGRDNGCITNTLGQITSEPNRVSLTVNKANLTHDMIAESGKFSASVISENADFELFRHFGFRSGRDVDKFADFSCTKRLDNGLLAVTEGTNAVISGQVIQSVDLGTHTMFIADVTGLEVLSDAPSATYDFYQNNIKPKPQAVGKTEDGQTVWRCTVCGYEYVGEELPEDFVCPLCKHPASESCRRALNAPSAEWARTSSRKRLRLLLRLINTQGQKPRRTLWRPSQGSLRQEISTPTLLQWLRKTATSR